MTEAYHAFLMVAELPPLDKQLVWNEEGFSSCTAITVLQTQNNAHVLTYSSEGQKSTVCLSHWACRTVLSRLCPLWRLHFSPRSLFQGRSACLGPVPLLPSSKPLVEAFRGALSLFLIFRLFFPFKDLCDYTGPTRMIQGNPFSTGTTSIPSAIRMPLFLVT